MTTTTINTKATTKTSPALSINISLPESLYVILRKHVTAIATNLDSDKEYTLQSLLGSDFWSSLSDGERRLAGIHMANIVKEKLVPYEFGGKCCQSPKVYCVII